MTIFAGFIPYTILVLAGLLGWVSLLGLTIFLYLGSPAVFDLNLGTLSLLAWDAFLCLAFFIQHSGMIRKSFQGHLAKLAPPYCHRAIYSIASGAVLLVLLVFWQSSNQIIVSLQGPLRWLVLALFFASAAGFAWGVRALDSFDAFGIQPVLAHLRGSQVRSAPFVIRGPYRWVRHPLYLFSLILIWSCPDVTIDRLLFNVLWTTWIVIGTMLEERDLVREFGNAYKEYQCKVPMLIPWRFPKAT